jgi:hypothetical protein
MAAAEAAFEFDEGKLREIPIVRQVFRHHIRRGRTSRGAAARVHRIAAQCNIG